MAALAAGKVHVTALPPLTYLLAHQQGSADVMLVANHFGSFGYGTQILAHADSGFFSYFDTKTNLNTADALTALQQFSGGRPCWVEPQSLAGYVLPWGIFTEQGISLQPGALLQTHSAVIRALYVQGICDFGATYATPGDPRTSSAVLDDLDDALSKVFIVWRSDAIIPNTNISIYPGFPALFSRSLGDALLNLAKSEDGKILLSKSFDYEIEDFKKVDDTYYEPLRYFAALAELDLSQMLGK
jgi:phosphonate transport system substrate-binding protein